MSFFCKVCDFSSPERYEERKKMLASFVVFFLEPTDENMSVLPTNAAVFYVIFIDKDVDIF